LVFLHPRNAGHAVALIATVSKTVAVLISGIVDETAAKITRTVVCA
jgi:hypothetical protein